MIFDFTLCIYKIIILGYLESIFRFLTVDGAGDSTSGTTNPIELTERAFDRWNLRLHFCEESVVSQCLF